MTEEEAKTKWCPFARVGSSTSGLGGFNRFIEPVSADSDARARCLGSACMAFRRLPVVDWSHQFKELLDGNNWIGAIKLHRQATGSSLKDAKDFVDGVRGGTRPMPTSAPAGFCGLAGRP